MKINKLPEILVLERDGLDLWAPGLLLKPLGFGVRECTTSVDAMAILEAYEIDILFINTYHNNSNIDVINDFIEAGKAKKRPVVASYIPAGWPCDAPEHMVVPGVSTPVHRVEHLLSWIVKRFAYVQAVVPHIQTNLGRGRRRKSPPSA